MCSRMNEDVAWERLKDLQREMENSRMPARSMLEVLAWLARPLVWAWELAALTLRPLPAFERPGFDPAGDDESTRDAA